MSERYYKLFILEEAACQYQLVVLTGSFMLKDSESVILV